MTTELAIYEDIAAVTTFDPPKIDDFLKKLRDRETSVVGDISTEEGRAEIASRAYKIARTKTAIKKAGDELKEGWAAQVKTVTKEQQRIWAEMEAIQHDVRKPLTEWEQADELRVQGHEKALLTIQNGFGGYAADVDLATIDDDAKALSAFKARDWEEFSSRANIAIQDAEKSLTEFRARRVKEIADAAELVELRRKEAEREEADRVRREAEAKALLIQQKADRTARAEAERIANEAKAAAAKADQDRLDAIARANKAEQDRVAAEQQQKADKEAADRRAAELAAENERKAKEREAAAAKAERDLAAKVLADEQAALAKREADTAHKKKINNEVLTDLAEFHSGNQEKEKKINCRHCCRENSPRQNHIPNNYKEPYE